MLLAKNESPTPALRMSQYQGPKLPASRSTKIRDIDSAHQVDGYCKILRMWIAYLKNNTESSLKTSHPSPVIRRVP